MKDYSSLKLIWRMRNRGFDFFDEILERKLLLLFSHFVLSSFIHHKLFCINRSRLVMVLSMSFILLLLTCYRSRMLRWKMQILRFLRFFSFFDLLLYVIRYILLMIMMKFFFVDWFGRSSCEWNFKCFESLFREWSNQVHVYILLITKLQSHSQSHTCLIHIS